MDRSFWCEVRHARVGLHSPLTLDERPGSVESRFIEQGSKLDAACFIQSPILRRSLKKGTVRFIAPTDSSIWIRPLMDRARASPRRSILVEAPVRYPRGGFCKTRTARCHAPGTGHNSLNEKDIGRRTGKEFPCRMSVSSAGRSVCKHKLMKTGHSRSLFLVNDREQPMTGG